MSTLRPHVTRRNARATRRIRFADIRPVYVAAENDELTPVVRPCAGATGRQPAFYKENIRLSYASAPPPVPVVQATQKPAAVCTRLPPSCSEASHCSPSSPCTSASPDEPASPNASASPSASVSSSALTSPNASVSPPSPTTLCSPRSPMRTIQTLTKEELRTQVDDAVRTALIHDLSRSLNAQERNALRPPHRRVYPILRERIARHAKKAPCPRPSRAVRFAQRCALLLSIVSTVLIVRTVSAYYTASKQLAVTAHTSVSAPRSGGFVWDAPRQDYVRLRVCMDVLVDPRSEHGRRLSALKHRSDRVLTRSQQLLAAPGTTSRMLVRSPGGISTCASDVGNGREVAELSALSIKTPVLGVD